MNFPHFQMIKDDQRLKILPYSYFVIKFNNIDYLELQLFCISYLVFKKFSYKRY